MEVELTLEAVKQGALQPQAVGTLLHLVEQLQVQDQQTQAEVEVAVVVTLAMVRQEAPVLSLSNTLTTAPSPTLEVA